MIDYRANDPFETDRNWYLLPSYYMHKYVLRKSLKILNASAPPTYFDIGAFGDQRSQLSTDSGIILNNLDSLGSYDTMDIKIYTTKDENKIGNSHALGDSFEYQQGDFVHGYALIKNKKKYTVNFSILYIIFEGFLRVDGNEKKFLSMIDFDASMSGICKDEYDASDKTYILNSYEIQPKRTYKKFFKFKMPDYILGDKHTCLTQHLLLPPSFDAKRDLGLLTASIKYRICAYIISENSMEYFKIGYKEKYIQVIPHHTSQIHDYYSFRYFISQLHQEIQYYYKRKFDILLKEIDNEPTTIFKYKENMVHIDSPPSISELKYIPPIPNNPLVNQTVSISFKMRGHDIPDITGIQCELVSITVESRSPIPMEMTPSMFYANLSSQTFPESLRRPAKKLRAELTKSNILLPKFVSACVNFITNSAVKYSYLTIDDTSYSVKSTIGETKMDIAISMRSTHLKNLDKAIVANRIGGFCLTPSFQISHLARLYFFKIMIGISDGTTLYLHNPVYIS